MYFDSWSAFFAMGTHGFYVWLAYGAAFLVIVANYLTVRRRHRLILAEIEWAAKAKRASAGNTVQTSIRSIGADGANPE